MSATAEACRDERRFAGLTGFAREIRMAWRRLILRPVFAACVVGSLVIGIGGNVAVFTVMRAALWRPLPISHPEELVQLHAGRTNTAFSYVLFQELRDAAHGDLQLEAVTTPQRHRFGMDVTSRERVMGSTASAGLFDLVGVPPAAGRLLRPDDEQPSAERVAVLSHRFWEDRFHGDPGVIGTLVYYDDTPVRIVGVSAGAFAGMDAERPVDVWLPVTSDLPAGWRTSVQAYWLTLFARLRTGTAAAPVEHALDASFRSHYEREILPGLPASVQARLRGRALTFRPAASGVALSGRRYETQLRVLAAILACVFLICCVNVGSLVRAMNEKRRDEFALRRALGAGRLQIARQLIAEGALLGGAGTVGGLLAAPFAARQLVRLALGSRGVFDLGIDPWIAGAAAALGVIATIGAITWPAWRASLDRASSGWRRVTARSVGRATVAVQLATVLVLLVVAGLTLSTMRRLANTGLGFDPRSVDTIELSFPKAAPADTSSAAVDRLLESLRQEPDVSSVTYAFPSVYDTGGMAFSIVPLDYRPSAGEDTQAGVIDAGPDFFDTLGIRLVAGRGFDRADAARRDALVVVNDRFARKYFGTGAATGRLVSIEGHTATIVGVAADVRHYGAKSDPWPMVYRSAPASAASALIVRTRAGASPTSLRTAVERAGTAAQVERVTSLEDVVRSLIGEERMLGIVSAAIASVALGLAALGLYGLVAYGASNRRAEFGIRLALGARRWQIQRLVVRQTAAGIVGGVVAGIVGAVAAARVMRQFLAESPALDWRILGAAVAILVGSALFAAWLPAWRAARIDPAVTLRAD